MTSLFTFLSATVVRYYAIICLKPNSDHICFEFGMTQSNKLYICLVVTVCGLYRFNMLEAVSQGAEPIDQPVEGTLSYSNI